MVEPLHHFNEPPRAIQRAFASDKGTENTLRVVPERLMVVSQMPESDTVSRKYYYPLPAGDTRFAIDKELGIQTIAGWRHAYFITEHGEGSVGRSRDEKEITISTVGVTYKIIHDQYTHLIHYDTDGVFDDLEFNRYTRDYTSTYTLTNKEGELSLIDVSHAENEDVLKGNSVAVADTQNGVHLTEYTKGMISSELYVPWQIQREVLDALVDPETLDNIKDASPDLDISWRRTNLKSVSGIIFRPLTLPTG